MNLLFLYLFFLVYIVIVMLRSDELFDPVGILVTWAACCIVVTVAADLVSMLVMGILLPFVMLLEHL